MEIKPTRSELIKLKQKIKLAKSGYNLLKKKRDGLILEFFKILEKAKSIRADLSMEYKRALYNINIARAVESDMVIKSVALGVKEKVNIEMETKNIMGVIVPKIRVEKVNVEFNDGGYGLISSSLKIDEAANAYEQVLDKVILAAEIETSMKRVLREIEKTKRRVNALEYVVIPKMRRQMEFIRLRLEEMERENIFRLKRIKSQ